MRALPLLPCLAIACSAARPPPARPVPRCDELSLLGKAEPAALAADLDGGLAIAGRFEGRVRAGAATLEAAAPSIFALRTNADGSVRWLHLLAGATPQSPGAVAITASGDVIVAGSVASHCAVARLAAADGHELWTFRLAGDGESNCRALSVDAAGDVWTTGYFSGSITGASSNGLYDLFVLKFAGDRGTATLVRAIGGKGKELPRAIVALPSGEVLVAGQFGGEAAPEVSAVDFGKGPVRSAGDYDGFLLKLGAGGKTQWVATFGDNGDDEINALAVGPDGWIYASGHRQPAGDYRDINPHDVVNLQGIVLHYSPEGRGDWVRILDGPASYANVLAFDEWGRLWTAGGSRGIHSGAVDIPPAGKTDAFALALNPNDGEPLGFRAWASPEFEIIRGIARIPGGLALTGFTAGELQICGKPVGSPGEQTAFVMWLRDL